jgi:hypothetical protein
MAVRNLASVDGFVVVDFADAPATGIVRRARKILQSSATDLARSLTYGFASFGVERSGASAGINATDDGADDAIAAFVAELSEDAEAGSLHLLEGKGLPEGSLAVLNPPSPVGTTTTVSRLSPTTAGVLAACEWAAGGDLDGARVAIEQTEAAPAPSDLIAAATERGAVIVDVAGVDTKPWLIWGADADLILPGSKPGVMTHQGAAMVTARAVIPWGPIPITTKALATLMAADVLYVPDFLSAHGEVLVGHMAGLDAVSAGGHRTDGDPIGELQAGISNALRAADASNEPLFLAACHIAEDRLRQWRDTLPFGRPLAA